MTRYGIILIWVAVFIFAASNSIVSILNNLGIQHQIEGRNVISFCNVLFVGNLCALVPLVAIYHKDWRRSVLATLKWRHWFVVVILAILSGALGPALIFLAIENTTVTNVVLVGRLEPPLLLVLSILFLRDRPSRWILIGAGITLAGVATIFVLQSKMHGQFMLGKGEYQAAAGAAVLVVSTIISKRYLSEIPLGIFTVVRTGLGAIIFFIVAAYLFGFGHFQDAFSPFLWQWMALYGGVIIVAGQLCWFIGLRVAQTSQVSLATSVSPLAGVVFAFLLLGEKPDMAIYIGGGVILLGVIVAQLGPKLTTRAPDPLEAEGKVSFKGI